MTELRVIRAVDSDRCRQSGVIESLLRIVIRMKSVAAFDKIQHPHISQRKIRHIGHLSVRIDGVSEVGGMYVFVAHTEPERGCSYARGIVRRQSG